MIRATIALAALAILLAAPAALAGSGDCNADGIVDIADKDCVLAVLGATADDAGYVANADVDDDGIITLADVGALLQSLQAGN